MAAEQNPLLARPAYGDAFGQYTENCRFQMPWSQGTAEGLMCWQVLGVGIPTSSQNYLPTSKKAIHSETYSSSPMTQEHGHLSLRTYTLWENLALGR